MAFVAIIVKDSLIIEDMLKLFALEKTDQHIIYALRVQSEK
jgi:hypothetical protein